MTSPSVSYKRHRFPPAIIAHAVWVYFRFPLSLRLVEEMLHERGIVVSYETVRRWAMKFGRLRANMQHALEVSAWSWNMFPHMSSRRAVRRSGG